MVKRIFALLLAALLLLGAFGCTADEIFVADIIYDAVTEDLYGGEYTENYDTPYDEDTPPPAEPAEPIESIEPTEPTEPAEPSEPTDTDTDADIPTLDPDGAYTTKEDVALYIHLYGTLPPNFMTKSEARELGWSSGGLDDYAPGMCIGGDYFGNFEGLLPAKDGRKFTECDINTLGADSRGPERIVFSNDGLIYYTPDHYETFELMYGDE